MISINNVNYIIIYYTYIGNFFSFNNNYPLVGEKWFT